MKLLFLLLLLPVFASAQNRIPDMYISAVYDKKGILQDSVQPNRKYYCFNYTRIPQVGIKLAEGNKRMVLFSDGKAVLGISGRRMRTYLKREQFK